MRDEVGDIAAAERALNRALEIAEPDRVVLPFTVAPVPALLERHARTRSTHAGLIAEIFPSSTATARPRPRLGPRPCSNP
jgi:LuxR family maltose regulon positive regulatory protein